MTTPKSGGESIIGTSLGESAQPKWLSSVLIAIIASGTAARFIGFARPFEGWQDFHTAFYALGGAGRRLGSYDKWPPFTDWLSTGTYWLFGEGEAGFRIIPILTSIIGIWLIYLLAKDLFNRQVALLAAALLALFPYEIYFARLISYQPLIVLAILGYWKWTRSKRKIFLALSSLAVLLGSGFSYSVFVIASLPILYLGIRSRDWKGLLGVIQPTVIGGIVWFSFLRLQGSTSFVYAVSADNPLWLLQHQHMVEWLRASGTYLWNGLTPILLGSAWLGLVISLERHRKMMPTHLLLLWCLSNAGWLLMAPLHSSTHDIWWLTVSPPLAILGAWALYQSLWHRRVGYVLLVITLSAAGIFSYLETRKLLSFKHSEATVGKLLGSFMSPKEIIIGPTPMEIWYSGSQGYLWSHFGQSAGPVGFSTILLDQRPRLVITARRFLRDWIFWGDTPPYANRVLQSGGYAPVFIFQDRTIYSPQDAREEIKSQFISLSDPNKPNLLENGSFAVPGTDGEASLQNWKTYRVSGASSFLVRSVNKMPQAVIEAPEPASAILYQDAPAEPGQAFAIFGQVVGHNISGEAYIQVAFLNKDGHWISIYDSGPLEGSFDWVPVSLLTRAPPETTKVQVNLRMNGTGRASFRDIRLFLG